jgi:hypothetical protein
MNTRRILLVSGLLIWSSLQAVNAQEHSAGVDALSGGRPQPLAPAAGVTVHSRPAFVWSSVPGAVAFVLQISPDSSFGSFLVSDTLATDTSAVSSRRFDAGMALCWRIGAIDSAGVCALSDPLWFMVGQTPRAGRANLADSRRDEWNTAVTMLRNENPFPVTVDTVLRHPRMMLQTRVPFVLGAGDSMVLTMTYRPQKFGTENDTLWLVGEDGRSGVPFSARCSPPLLMARLTQVVLGPCAVTDSAAATLEFTNGGPFNKLTVRRVRTRTQFFSASFLPVRMLEPGEVLRVPVRFHVRAYKPDAFGTYTDTCLVESDGGEGRVVLRGESPSPRAWIEPQALSFGDVAAGDTAIAMLHVMNRSVNELRIDSIGNRTRTVRPLVGKGRVGRTDTLLIPFRFIAGKYGTFTDTVSLVNNSWWGAVRVPVLARIPFPVLETGFDRMDFGSVRKGDTAGVVVRVSNASISALRVDSIRTRTRAFRFTRPQLPAIIRRGDTLSFTVYFFPDSVRYFADTLTIVSTTQGGTRRIGLSGNGTPPGTENGTRTTAGQFELYQNFPNPFRESTTFRYVLPEAGHVRLEIFTTLGQQVALLVDGEQEAGFHNITWTATVTSGVYYYRLVATPRSDPNNPFKGTRKMVVMR